MPPFRTHIASFLFWSLAVGCSVGQSVEKQLRTADVLYTQASKEIKRVFLEKGNYQGAKSKLEEARGIYAANRVRDERMAKVLHNLGVIYNEQNNAGKAIDYYLATIQIRKKLPTADSRNFFQVYLYIGNVYSKIGQIDSAEYYYKLSEKHVTQFKNQGSDLVYFYAALAKFHYYAGNCKACINSFEKSIIESNKAADKRYTLVSQHLKEMFASALLRCYRYQDAASQYRQLLGTYYDRNFILLKTGEAYLKLGKPDSALYFFRQARFDTDASNQIKLWNGLGEAYANLKNHPLALDCFNRAIGLNNRTFGDKNINLANAYAGIAQIHEARSQWPAALASYQAAIRTLHLSFTATDIYQNPKDVTNVVSRMDMFEVLRKKAGALQKYYASKPPNLSDLQAALQTYQLAIRLAENLRLSYDSDETKLFFNQQVFPVYEQAVSVAFALYEKTGTAAYAEQAFILSEKSKAAVLSETLRGLHINRQKGVPTELIRQERELRQSLTKLTVSGIEAKDPVQMVSLHDQMRDKEIELSQLVRKLDANDKYYQLKYNAQPVSIAKVQTKILDRKTALIEYFFGERELLAFVVTQHGFRGFRLSKDTILRQTLDKYKTSIYEHHFSPEQPAWANLLHRKLIAPLQAALAGKENLIIVPDGNLHYLPFEALVTDVNRERYLLEDYTIRYGYSGTLLSLAQTRGKANEQVLAMAPFAGKSGNAFRSLQIGALPASKSEVEQVGGRIYLESDATKEVFLKTASRYGIVHLATHAKADSKEPLNSYITFYPQHSDSISGYRLYTSELYNLQLDSVKLVVLSACETGGGQLVRGEGVMSLARAFAYAGCPNIVMTLWRAEDQATAQITTRMHEHLRRGTPKAEALRKSKLDYLREAPATRHNPYFWANLVLIGDNEPVYPPRLLYWVLGSMTVLLAAILAGLWLWRKRRSRRLSGAWF